MATFRVGVGSFNIKDGAVGFGTDTDSLGNLRVKGVTKTTGSIVSGASTLTRYSGFAADNISQLENITLTSEVGTIGDIVVGVGTSVIISSASTVTVGTVESVSIGTHFSPPKGGIEERGQDFVEGMMRFNTDLNTMEFYNGNEWRQFNYQADIKHSPSSRGRVLNFGGRDGPGNRVSTISFLNIMTFGNSQSFGELTAVRRQIGACSSEIRALTMGGSGPSGDVNEIAYHTIASEGNSIDFGNLQGAKQTCCSLSSSTRGITYGSGGSPYNQIDYVEIATLGDALDFGDTAVAARMAAPACSPVRGFKTGGTDDSISRSEKEFIIISSKGNGATFGDAKVSGPGGSGASNNIRAVIAGGYNYVSPNAKYREIEYFNMISLGESIYFGDLGRLSSFAAFGNAANQVRALFTGGYNTDGSAVTNTIDFITFATTGNAQDFGDLSEGLGQVANASDSHGGLGGY